MKRALGFRRFSLKRLNAEGFRGGLRYWGPGRCVKKGSKHGHLSHRGPFMSEGNLESGEGARIPGTLNDE